MVKKVVMPSAGQTTDVATVTKLCVAVGDAVRKGDVLMEVETDKAVLPIESFAKGFITEIFVSEFEKVDAGTLLLTIGDAADLEAAKSGAATEATPATEAAPAPQAAPAPAAPVCDDDGDDFVPVMADKKVEESKPVTLPMPNGRPVVISLPAMPNAKKLAAELGVELEHVAASNGSFIKASDVRAAAEAAAKAVKAEPAEAPADTIPTGRMRDSLARRWENSAAAPVFSVSVFADATAVMSLCEAAEATPAHFVMMALPRLAERYPLLGVVYAGGVQKVLPAGAAAIAVCGDNGTVSSAVANASALGLGAIARTAAANAAAILGGDMSSVDGAAFTVFDASGWGVDSFTPPLRTPETAAFGVAVDGDGKRITVSAAFDVRVWESRTALSLMSELKARLGDPALMLI